MSSPNLMGLVRELKALNAKKKSGQALSDQERQRRRELKAYLKTALEEQKSGGGGGGSAAASPEVTGSALSPSLDSQPPAPAPKPAAPVKVGKPKPAAPAPSPAPAAEPPKKKPDPRNAFAIDAAGLFEEAASSAAVAATHQTKKPTGGQSPSSSAGGPRGVAGGRAGAAGGVDLNAPLAGFVPQGKASKAELDEMVARSDQATRATKARPRSTEPEQVAVQLSEIIAESAYTETGNEDAYLLDDYFGGYQEDGYHYLEDDNAADLQPIDPREMELYKIGLGGSSTGGVESGEITITVPQGLAFLDDFTELYSTGVLPDPQDEAEPDLEDPDLLIPGRRKVTVHLLNGSSKRGVIRIMRKGDLGFTLEPLGSGQSEDISLAQIKAVFIQKGKGEPPVAQGQMITVTFRDRRKVQGATIDYQPGAQMFTLIPNKGQFERIIVNGGAVASVQ